MRVSSLPNLNITFSLMPSQFNVCSLLTPLYSILWRPIELPRDRKSTRLNSSHLVISYAVFCLKKKKILLLATQAQSTTPQPKRTALLPPPNVRDTRSLSIRKHSATQSYPSSSAPQILLRLLRL